jgi:hypothetical protein
MPRILYRLVCGKQLEIEYSMSTSRRQASKILGVISPTEAQRLLLDWANLPFDAKLISDLERVQASRKRMRLHYADIFAGFDDMQLVAVLYQIQKFLRKAWSSADPRGKDWYLTQMRDLYRELPVLFASPDAGDPYRPFHDVDAGDDFEIQSSVNLERMINNRFSEPPPITPFEAAVFYFQRALADRAKYCGGPDCAAPYFIAEKRWQKYCSPKCAGPATRESKRQWWRDNRAKNGGL